MKNPRYDYLPIIKRTPITWPNDGRIALWVAPNIEYFHFDMPIRGSGSSHTPDVPGYTLRDYGARVGIYRIMDVLDKYAIRAACCSTPRFANSIRRSSRKATSAIGSGSATA